MSFTVISELDEVEQLEAVERQDDQIAEAVYRMRKVAIEKQYIPELTDKTFPIETKEKDLLVVLFYLTCKQHLVLSEISITYQEIYFLRMNKFFF